MKEENKEQNGLRGLLRSRSSIVYNINEESYLKILGMYVN